MRSKFVVMVLSSLSLLVSCASSARYAYEESESCPVAMTEEQHESGVVRCRAMCSSYARDFAEFDAECKCRCAPPGGGYRAKPGQKPAPNYGQTSWYTQQ